MTHGTSSVAASPSNAVCVVEACAVVPSDVGLHQTDLALFVELVGRLRRMCLCLNAFEQVLAVLAEVACLHERLEIGQDVPRLADDARTCQRGITVGADGRVAVDGVDVCSAQDVTVLPFQLVYLSVPRLLLQLPPVVALEVVVPDVGELIAFVVAEHVAEAVVPVPHGACAAVHPAILEEERIVADIVAAVGGVALAVRHFRELLEGDVDAVGFVLVLAYHLHDIQTAVEPLGIDDSARLVVVVGNMHPASVYREQLPCIRDYGLNVRFDNDFVAVAAFRASRQEQNGGKERKEVFHRFVLLYNGFSLGFSISPL